MAREQARSAIVALEVALTKGPEVSHRDVADAVRHVIALRNRLIEQARAGEVPRSCLDRANALVSLAHGAEHPLMGVHRHRIEQTRDGLQALLDSA